MAHDRSQTKGLMAGDFTCSGKLGVVSYWFVSLKWCVFLISIHSLILGLSIYFSTDAFYRFFFHTRPENVFFVRQSGVFLFIIGLFYCYPLRSMKTRHTLVLLILLSKIIAVLFLLANAEISIFPQSIYLAALGDGVMAAILGVIYCACILKKCI
jgi:hypothetical protein